MSECSSDSRRLLLTVGEQHETDKELFFLNSNETVQSNILLANNDSTPSEVRSQSR